MGDGFSAFMMAMSMMNSMASGFQSYANTAQQSAWNGANSASVANAYRYYNMLMNNGGVLNDNGQVMTAEDMVYALKNMGVDVDNEILQMLGPMSSGTEITDMYSIINQLAQTQYADNYNSPAAMMQRFRDAGINLNMLYGQNGFTQANTTSGANSPIANSLIANNTRPSFDAQVSPLDGVISGFQQMTEAAKNMVSTEGQQIDNVAKQYGLTAAKLSSALNQNLIEHLDEIFENQENQIYEEGQSLTAQIQQNTQDQLNGNPELRSDAENAKLLFEQANSEYQRLLGIGYDSERQKWNNVSAMYQAYKDKLGYEDFLNEKEFNKRFRKLTIDEKNILLRTMSAELVVKQIYANETQERGSLEWANHDLQGRQTDVAERNAASNEMNATTNKNSYELTKWLEEIKPSNFMHNNAYNSKGLYRDFQYATYFMLDTFKGAIPAIIGGKALGNSIGSKASSLPSQSMMSLPQDLPPVPYN